MSIMKVMRRDPAAAAQRRARTVAQVGAAVAFGTAGLMVLAVGTAAADEPGRCNETVNVRSEPSPDAPIVGVCQAGAPVQIGEIREGYLYLTDYEGWAAWEFLSIGGEPTDPASTEPTTTSTAPTAAATTVTPLGQSDVEDATGGDTSSSGSTLSTTPTADPAPDS